MKIRKVQEKDINELNELLRQVCQIHNAGRPDIFKYPAKKYTDSELIEIIHDPDKPILAAVNDSDVLIGYAFCKFIQHKDDNILTDIKTLYIDDICVDENMRGQHIGTALYNAVIDFARENGCYNVTLNVWQCNVPALKFYESLGMKPQRTFMETILSD